MNPISQPVISFESAIADICDPHPLTRLTGGLYPFLNQASIEERNQTTADGLTLTGIVARQNNDGFVLIQSLAHDYDVIPTQNDLEIARQMMGAQEDPAQKAKARLCVRGIEQAIASARQLAQVTNHKQLRALAIARTPHVTGRMLSDQFRFASFFSSEVQSLTPATGWAKSMVSAGRVIEKVFNNLALKVIHRGFEPPEQAIQDATYLLEEIRRIARMREYEEPAAENAVGMPAPAV